MAPDMNKFPAAESEDQKWLRANTEGKNSGVRCPGIEPRADRSGIGQWQRSRLALPQQCNAAIISVHGCYGQHATWMNITVTVFLDYCPVPSQRDCPP
jgi:hypothetical protein